MKLKLDGPSFEVVEVTMNDLQQDAIKITCFDLSELACLVELELEQMLILPPNGVYCNLLENAVTLDRCVVKETDGVSVNHVTPGYAQLCYLKAGQPIAFNSMAELMTCRHPVRYLEKEGYPRVLSASWEYGMRPSYSDRPFDGLIGLKVLSLFIRYEIDNLLTYMPAATSYMYLNEYIRWPDFTSGGFSSMDRSDIEEYTNEYGWKVHSQISRLCAKITRKLEDFIQGFSQHIVATYREANMLYVAIKEDHRARLYEHLLQEIKSATNEGYKGISIDSKGNIRNWG